MRSTLIISMLVCFFTVNYTYSQHATVLHSDETHNMEELMEMEMHGGKPFMDVLREKQATHNIANRELEPHQLSLLFKAANGTAHPGELHNRTAIAPMDAQCVSIYVLAQQGVFIYDVEAHRLKKVEKSDYRNKITSDPTIHKAPIVILYVMEPTHMTNIKEENRSNFAYLQAGSIAQNICLYCASEDLATNLSYDLRKDDFSKNMKIKASNLLFIQAVGHRE